jgi:uncharacterized membrane protein YjjP (DUF1212 family)
MSQLHENAQLARSLDDIIHAPSREDPVGFILRLTKALHTYGVPAYELEQIVNASCDAMGFGVQCLSTPTAITMTLLPPNEIPQTYVIRVSPGEVNMDKLICTTDIAENVIAKTITTKDGADQLKMIAQRPPLYPNWLIIIAFALVSAGIARIFTGGIEEIISAATIGLVIGFMSTQLRKIPFFRYLLPAISALVATLVAFLLNHFMPQPIAIFVVLISGLIILLPGMTLTIAMAELATENLVSGTARFFGAVIIFIQLAFGSAIGVQVGQILFGPIAVVELEPVAEWTIWLAVTVAVVALVPLFEAKFKETPWFILAAVTAFGTVRYSSPYIGPFMGAFVGAISVGLIAKFVSQFFNKPGAIILMPGLLILVPGSVGYKSILALIEKDILKGLETAFEVSIIAISLVAGLLVSSLLKLPKRETMEHD